MTAQQEDEDWLPIVWRSLQHARTSWLNIDSGLHVYAKEVWTNLIFRLNAENTPSAKTGLDFSGWKVNLHLNVTYHFHLLSTKFHVWWIFFPFWSWIIYYEYLVKFFLHLSLVLWASFLKQVKTHIAFCLSNYGMESDQLICNQPRSTP